MRSDFPGAELKILSQMLAVLSLASIFIWPAYRVIKNISQRGRLPDMKAPRVYVTFGVLAVVLLLFFFLPLPVSRVHETGLVVVDPTAVEAVLLPEPARLKQLAKEARPGREVRAGDVLAEFESKPLEYE